MTDRNTPKGDFGTLDPSYFHYATNADGQKTVTRIGLNDRTNIFNTSKSMNNDGKVMYCKQLDKKGASKVPFKEAAAGTMSQNKIQKKAYRANTQSR